MAVEYIDIPFVGGVDTKSHPYITDKGATFDIENGVVNKQGVVEKRPGLDPLPTSDTDGNTISYPRKIIGYGDELVLLTSTHAYSYLSATDEWQKIGACPLMHITEDVVDGAEATTLFADTVRGVGYANGFYVLATNTEYSVVDAVSGRVVVDNTALTAAVAAPPQPPRCVAIGNIVLIVYSSTTANQISTRVLDMTDPTDAGSTVASIADADSGGVEPFWDIMEFSATRAVVAYRVSGGGNEVKIVFLDSAGAQTGPTVTPAVATSSYIALAKDATVANVTHFAMFTQNAGATQLIGIHAFYNDSSDTFTANNSLNVWAIGAETITAIVAAQMEDEATKFVVFWELDNNVPTLHHVYVGGTNPVGPALASPGTPTEPIFQWGAGIAARPIRTSLGKVFLPIVTESRALTPGDGTVISVAPIYNTGYLLNMEQQAVGRFLHGTAGLQHTTYGITDAGWVTNRVLNQETMWSDLVSPGTDQFVLSRTRMGPFLLSDSTGAGAGKLAGEVQLTTFDFNKGGESAEISGSLVINSGILWSYDHLTLREMNFLWVPEPVSLAEAAGGNLDGSGVYNVILEYRMLDAAGNLIHSVTSAPVQKTLTPGNQTIAVTAPTLRISSILGRVSGLLGSTVYIQVYRTEGGPGAIYYADAGQVNNPAANTVTINLTQADSTLIDNPQLYTTGDVFDDNHPTPATSITASNTRIFLGSQSNVVQYSKLRQEERVPAFNSAFRHLLPREGGEVTQVGVLGSNVIVWKEEAIYRFYGGGPNDTGAAGSFSDPEPISRSIGGRAGAPLLRIDEGYVFQSDKGLWLLAENLQLSYIGAGVEEYVEQEGGALVVGAARAEDEDQAQFAITGDNNVLALDTLTKRWTRILVSPSATLSVEDVARWNSKWVYLQKLSSPAGGGGISQETPGAYGTGHIMTVKTPWIKSQGFNSEGRLKRVQFLGQWKSAHTLTVKVYYDYSETVAQTVTFDLSSGYSADDPIQLRFKPEKQVFESVRFDIADSSLAGTFQSLDMIALRLEVQGKRKRRIQNSWSS